MQLAAVPETSWGVTPTTPVFQKLRVTSDTLTVSRENVTSSEKRPDRNVTDLIQVGGGASGSIDFELSYGSFDALFESLMHSEWGSDTLKNGTTAKSFTFERKIPTSSSTNEYMRFTGMQVNTMSLNCKAKEIVSGSLGFLGSGGAIGDVEITGATYSDQTVTDVMDAGTGFAGLSLGALTGAHILSLSMEVTNNLRTASELGNVNALGVGYGRFEVSGSVEIYFEDSSILEAYLDGDAISLAFTLGATSGSKYKFSVPKLKFESGGLNVGGNDADLLMNLQWKGLYDPTEGCTLKIQRAVA